MKSMQPMEEWSIDKLIPYAKNAKIHTKVQIAKIAKSIEKHGLVNPPNIESDGTIITGHGRVEALKQLGWKTVPVFVRHDLTKAEAAAARLADNKVAEGEIDTNLLQEELRWLETEMIGDLTDMGFEERELSFLTEDIGKLDLELMDSVSTAASHETDTEHETELEIAKADGSRVMISKALGLKDVCPASSRQLTRFMVHVMEKTGSDDPEIALVAFAKEVMSHD